MEMIAKEIALLMQHKDMTDSITVYTCPPLVYKKFDKYYYHIILQGQGLRELMDYIYPTLRLASR
jgi:hypothetical protein